MEDRGDFFFVLEECYAGAFPPRRQRRQCLLQKTRWENNQYCKNKTMQTL